MSADGKGCQRCGVPRTVLLLLVVSKVLFVRYLEVFYIVAIATVIIIV
jgi:hypothetical protein